MVPAFAAPAPVAVPVEDPDVIATALLLMALETADARAFSARPAAVAEGGVVAAAVYVDTGDAGLPFPLAVVRMAAWCLRDDPPYRGAHVVAEALETAADDAEQRARILVGGLN